MVDQYHVSHCMDLITARKEEDKRINEGIEGDLPFELVFYLKDMI